VKCKDRDLGETGDGDRRQEKRIQFPVFSNQLPVR
jgi:hypothetical protein